MQFILNNEIKRTNVGIKWKVKRMNHAIPLQIFVKYNFVVLNTKYNFVVYVYKNLFYIFGKYKKFL